MKLLKSILLTVAALSTVSALTGCASDAELIAGCNRGDVSSCRSLAASRAAARSMEGYALSGGDSMATGAYVGNSNLTPADMQAVRQSNEARRPRITTCSPNVDGSITCTSF